MHAGSIIRLTLVAGLLAALALPAGQAAAAYPGRNGSIVFVGERGGVTKLYVRSHGRTRGFLSEGAPADPVYSPQGRRLAVTRELPDSGRAIWIFNADGSAPRRLTASEQSGAHATWAPGGRFLAYAAGPHGQRTIHTIRADGLRDTPIIAGPADQHDPAWSRHDTIAFVQSDPRGDNIYTVPAAGGAPRRLTFKRGNDAHPAWSPGGGQIAFVRGTGGVWVMSRWGRGGRRVAHIPGGIENGVAWSPDGRRLVFAGGPPGRRQLYTVRLNGRGLRAISLSTSNGRDPDWRAVGQDPLIAAAGDVACPPTGNSFNAGFGTRRHCAMARTAALMLRPDLWDVLALGDLQYPDGNLGFFYDSYHLAWGLLKPITRPAPGNHEYRKMPGATGYFNYFDGIDSPGGRAGSRARGGYYSFEIGAWHAIALNSNCSRIPGGCDVGSPQQRWLAADLAAHPARCTLAFWHHPLFSSLAFEEGRGSKETAALWETLYEAGADVVLSGHQHFYERLAPQDVNGSSDPARGIRSFVVGTGGKSLDKADFRDHNSSAFSSSAFGILELRLHPRSYDWRFRSAGPERFTDAGTAVCH